MITGQKTIVEFIRNIGHISPEIYNIFDSTIRSVYNRLLEVLEGINSDVIFLVPRCLAGCQNIRICDSWCGKPCIVKNLCDAGVCIVVPSSSVVDIILESINCDTVVGLCCSKHYERAKSWCDKYSGKFNIIAVNIDNGDKYVVRRG